MLHYIILHYWYITLHYTTLCYIILHYITLYGLRRGDRRRLRLGPAEDLPEQQEGESFDMIACLIILYNIICNNMINYLMNLSARGSSDRLEPHGRIRALCSKDKVRGQTWVRDGG